jgi:hypothetical protein
VSSAAPSLFMSCLIHRCRYLAIPRAIYQDGKDCRVKSIISKSAQSPVAVSDLGMIVRLDGVNIART